MGRGGTEQPGLQEVLGVASRRLFYVDVLVSLHLHEDGLSGLGYVTRDGDCCRG
jgi:hypothetical protein